MGSASTTAKTVFFEALEIASIQERQALLDARCGGDAELRRAVEELLRHHEQINGFLETPPTAVASLADTARETHASITPTLSFLSPAQRAGSLGRLGHYEILEVIGSGGFGVVFKAHDEKLQRVVAIKTLAESLAASATARKRFVREAQAAAAVRHDNVVALYAVEDAGPVPYLVMELVNGVSLEEKLQQDGPLELKEVLRIGLQIADGLAAAHKQGLVHRDVKPANILLENGVQRVKITDFGLARGVDDAALTQTGLIAGTPTFMSPEQARGELVDARSDLFSLGSVLYALCTGQVPFSASNSLAVAKKVCEETPLPISELNPAVPLWLSEIVARLHAKDPAKRFQSAVEVAELLGSYLGQVQQASMGLPVIVKAHRGKSASPQQGGWQPSPNVRRGLMVLAAVLVLVGATLGFTEARGVTHLALAIIRIFTPEGTLVVEVDDPGVRVTIEGDGGLSITGAGPQEVRLRPGSYRLRADKNGQLARPDRDLVSISHGDRQVVRIRFESKSPPAAAPPAVVATTPESQPFVILGREDGSDQKLSTLAGAVLKSGDGDTIEIRGNGPFVSPQLTIATALTIRAGAGYRPVIQAAPGVESAQPPYFVLARAPLTLEGLEFQGSVRGASECTFAVLDAPCYVANCRFSRCMLTATRSPSYQVRNSHFSTQTRSPSLSVFSSSPEQTQVVDNNLVTNQLSASGPGARINIRRNLVMGMQGCLAVPASHPSRGQLPVGLHVSQSIFVGSPIVRFTEVASEPLRTTAAFAAELEAIVRTVIHWREDGNLYSEGASFLEMRYSSGRASGGGWIFTSVAPSRPCRTLSEWNEFWGQTDTGAVQGRVQFQGGDAVYSTPHTLQPDDFRVQTDSTGYRAGPDGKDLGPNIDLVGPGAAYERWKKTPEYEKWLEETGQKK